jgi:hypothetical protein
VATAGRQVVWSSWRHPEQPSLGVEQVEQRKEVALVGAAAVQQHQGARGIARRLPPERGERRFGLVVFGHLADALTLPPWLPVP